ncbi:TrmB family transcriptional regulator [Candidatus Bathyarchaeota archaeon]|nr:TrmB family transcriptional regulator [Candidatus Bathyarchaeota archaeon]
MGLSVEKPESIMKLYDESSGVWRFVKADKGAGKSMEILEKTLRNLGLSKNEVRVYLYLARTGEHKASEISEALSLHRTETYRILRDLEKRGLVSSVFEKPLKFIATPFDRALDILIETKRMKLHLLEKKRAKLIDIWLSLPRPEVEQERKEVFQILEGDEQITLKADDIISKAEKEILVFISECDIAGFYHSGLLDRLEMVAKDGVKVKLLTDYSPKTCFFLEQAKIKQSKYVSSETDDLPTFIITDDSQLLLLIRKENGKKRIAALWTNYEAFIKALKTLFNELWNTAS